MIYMVTAGTLNKEHFFRGDDRLELLQNALLEILDKYGWIVQAWAVFVNHYHFVAKSPKTESSLSGLIKELHSITAREVNCLDLVYGRQVWFQYWDTALTYEKSWLARLNYVNNNAVRHGMVRVAAQYPYCSARWFPQILSPSFCRKVESFRYDRLKIEDEF